MNKISAMKVAVIGASGFVGSAFVRYLRSHSFGDIELTEVARSNYERCSGNYYDVVIHCAGNSRKYFAEQSPFDEFDTSVGVVTRGLRDFPANCHILISSVDVYADLTNQYGTKEESTVSAVSSSHYGFHKYLAEEVVRHHATSWLVFRLAGMVGPGLKKNPVFDLMNGLPLRIHPDSRYQYIQTDDVASLCWTLVSSGVRGEVFNVCGAGTMTMREIAELVGIKSFVCSFPPETEPRIVDIDITKIRSRLPVADTRASLASFLSKQNL